MYFLLGIASFGLFGNYFLITIAVFFILFIYMLIKKNKIVIPTNRNFYLLSIFCIAYAIISNINRNFSYIILLSPILSYYSGIIIYSLCENDEKYITKCIFAIAIGFFAHAMLNYITNIGSLDRNIVDFWSQSPLAATLQGILVTMILSIFFYNIFCTNSIWQKILFTISTILSLAYLTLIGTRTPIIIFITITMIEFIFYMLLNKTIKKCIKIILMVGILVTAIIYMYNHNLFELKNFVEESNLFVRLNKDATIESDKSRLETQWLAIISVIDNPFGTSNDIGDLSYAHNMWLDVAKDVGIIPFTILVAYTIYSIVSLLQIMKNANVSKEYKILLSSVYIGVLTNFLTEPILQGFPFYFFMFVLINAIIDIQAKEIKNNEKIKNV